MKGLVSYLKEMYDECQIPFQVYIDDEHIFETNPDFTKSNLVEIRFDLGSKKCKIEIEEKYKKFLKVFKFCIEKRYKEDYSIREKVIIELLEDTYMSKEKIKDTMLEIDGNIYLITISLKDRIMEALDILKSIYTVDVTVVKYKKSIVLIGAFEYIEEHLSSISETLYTSIYERCYISYCSIKNYENLSSLYEDSVYKTELAKRYNLSNRIFGENDLMLEKIINSLSDQIKSEIVSKFNESFSKLDEDIIKTIDIFFKFDLNLSEAAKELYVHRNTLIYRLDKIQKYTSYDIRKFNDAVLFKIAFFIWKDRYRN